MASDGWEFWKIASPNGEVAWLGITRPGGRSALDRRKVWTLVPGIRQFVANWFVTEDHMAESGQWVHENIDIDDARAIINEIPEPSRSDLDRLVRPERVLGLNEIDRFTVEKVMGKRADLALRGR